MTFSYGDFDEYCRTFREDIPQGVNWREEVEAMVSIARAKALFLSVVQEAGKKLDYARSNALPDDLRDNMPILAEMIDGALEEFLDLTGDAACVLMSVPILAVKS